MTPVAQPARRLAPAAMVGALVLAGVLAAGCTAGPVDGVLRLGYFPNLTHAQALYGVESGLYQRHLNATRLETQVFTAGPTAFETLLAGRIDVIYVGPSPTISALERKGLDVVVVVAGSAAGGASFVTRPGIDGPEDLAGRSLASPQLGNTQDVALKHYLQENGLERRDQGGDVEIVNAAPADILTLFSNGHIDGAWVPEPWATRLVTEAGGKVLLDEASLWPDGRFVTTHVVTTRAFLALRPDDVRNLLAAHAEATRLLQEGAPATVATVNDALQSATGKRLGDATMQAAFPRINFTSDPLQSTFLRQYEMSHDLGFAKSPPDVARVYDLSYLPKDE